MRCELRRLFIAPEKGARTSLYLADQAPENLTSGTYYVNCKPAKTNPLVDDAGLRGKIWARCCRVILAVE